MAADVKVSGNLFYREVAFESAASFRNKGLFCDFILSLHVGLSQQLEIFTLVDRIPVAIEPILLHRPQIGAMRHHGVLDIKRNDLARKMVHENV